MGRGEVNLEPKFRERNAIRALNDPGGTSKKRTIKNTTRPAGPCFLGNISTKPIN
jgi:hypothetical protein